VVILARAAEGLSPDGAKAAAEVALADFPNLDVRTKAEYKDFVAGQIGLLRAVGLSRGAVRAMIRWEAVIVSLIGAVVGLALGVFLGVVSVLSVPIVETLSIPWISLIVFLLAAAAFGVLAAFLPARRAARLDILEAVRHE
jgi:ABC-type antimicrobial peptide transport system permease subunit